MAILPICYIDSAELLRMKNTLLVFLVWCSVVAGADDPPDPHASEANLEPLCADEGTSETTHCWVELEDVENCFVWSTVVNRNLTAAVETNDNISCPENVLNGKHQVDFTYTLPTGSIRMDSFEGPWRDGRKGAGKWIDTNAIYRGAEFIGDRNDLGLRIGEWLGESEGGHRESWTIEFRDDKRHGRFRRASRGGTQQTAEYRNGELHGPVTLIYPDGKTRDQSWKTGELTVDELKNSHGNLLYRTEFANGVRNGRHVRNYYANEDDPYFNQQVEIQYVDDVPVGTKIIRHDTDSDGEVNAVEQIPYVDGVLSGIGIYESEGYRSEVPFVDGEKHGVRETLWDQGDKRETPYVQGKKHGMETYVWKNGDRRETPFVDGKKEGMEVWHDKEGLLKETPYVNDVKHGVEVVYYMPGSRRETPWVEGEIQGVEIFFPGDGQRLETPYVDGKRQGTEKLFNADDELIRTREFVEGEEVEPTE